MAKRVRPKLSEASNYPTIPTPVLINPQPVLPQTHSTVPKTLTGNFGQSCQIHFQPTNIYCYKDRKFICEMCTSDTSLYTKGVMRSWAMKKKIIDKKKNLKIRLNDARKKLDEQYNSIKAELEASYTQAKNSLVSFSGKEQPYSCFNENEETSKLQADLAGLVPEQYDDIFNLQFSSEFQEESKEIDDEFNADEEIIGKYVNKLEDKTSPERAKALDSVKNLFILN